MKIFVKRLLLLVAVLLPLNAVYAAAALRQEDTPNAADAVATTITSNALPEAALVGDTIEVWVAWEAGTDVITSCIDGASQTYSLIGHIDDTTDASEISVYAVLNNASNTALSVTCTWNGSGAGARNIHVREISGTNNGVPAVNFPARIVTPGTGANAISIALTSSASSGLISCVIAAVAGPASLAAGTGFTGTVPFGAGAGFHASLFESKVLTATGSNPCTWTDATDGGTSTYLGGGVIWGSAGTVMKANQMMMGVD